MDSPPRIYYLSLPLVGLTIGAAVLLAHLFGLLRPADTQKFLLKLPRSRMAGIVFLAGDAVGCFWLILNIGFVEFGWVKALFQPGIPVLVFSLVNFFVALIVALSVGDF